MAAMSLPKLEDVAIDMSTGKSLGVSPFIQESADVYV